MNRNAERGSNSWVIGGQHTANGKPILASDPHLTLETPSTLHPIALQGGGFDMQGDSLPGTPYLILGQNRDITYGATQHFVDVTDTYIEKIQPDPASPSGLSTMYQGKLEPVAAIDEKYRVNPRIPGQQDVLNDVSPSPTVPAKTLIVPRRNNGPLVAVNLAAGTALSVQYTGWSPTTELEVFRRSGLARNVDDFRDAMQYFDIGGQHFIYADTKGNIGNSTAPARRAPARSNGDETPANGSGDDSDWLVLLDSAGSGVLAFQKVPTLARATWHTHDVPMQMHHDSACRQWKSWNVNDSVPPGGPSLLHYRGRWVVPHDERPRLPLVARVGTDGLALSRPSRPRGSHETASNGFGGEVSPRCSACGRRATESTALRSRRSWRALLA